MRATTCGLMTITSIQVIWIGVEMRRSFKKGITGRAARQRARRKGVLFAIILFGLARLLGSMHVFTAFNYTSS